MVGLPSEAMGRRTGQLLLERIQKSAANGSARNGKNGHSEPAEPSAPVREAYPVELLIGRSCGCPAAVY
jgi:hypothetical protein